MASPMLMPRGTMNTIGSTAYAVLYAASGTVPKVPTRKHTTCRRVAGAGGCEKRHARGTDVT